MNLATIREAFAQAIQDGVERPVQAYPYMPADPQFPCIVITPATDWVQPHESYGLSGALVELQWDVLIGGTGRPEDALRTIDEMVSMGDDAPSSVIAAIETASGDPGQGNALGGLVESMYCESVSMLSPGQPNAPVFAAAVRVLMLVRR